MQKPFDACAVDRSCGCTLPSEDLGLRVADLRDAFALLRAADRARPTELVFRFRNAPGALAKIDALAEKERACCAFLESEVSLHDGDVVWRLRSPPSTAHGLDAFERLAALSQSGMDERDVRAVLDAMNAALAAAT